MPRGEVQSTVKAGVPLPPAQTSSGAEEKPGSDLRQEHGHCQGLLCTALESRLACARAAAWGMCARARGRKKRRERERALDAVFNSCGQIWSSVRFARFLTCVFLPHQHQLTQPMRGLRHHLACPFFYKSITCRCCGGYTKGYTVCGHRYSMSG